MEYNFEITEMLSKQIAVQSSSVEEAYRIVKELYNDEKIVLDASDFIDVDICERKDFSKNYFPCLNRNLFPF